MIIYIIKWFRRTIGNSFTSSLLTADVSEDCWWGWAVLQSYAAQTLGGGWQLSVTISSALMWCPTIGHSHVNVRQRIIPQKCSQYPMSEMFQIFSIVSPIYLICVLVFLCFVIWRDIRDSHSVIDKVTFWKCYTEYKTRYMSSFRLVK